MPLSNHLSSESRDAQLPMVGREVSCRPIGFFFKELEREGHAPDRLCEGLPYSRQQLTGRHARIDWASYQRLLTNLGRIWSADELVQAGSRLANSRWVQPFGAIARLVLSVDELYRWTMDPRTGVARQQLTCVNNELRRVGPRRLEVRASMAPGYEPSRELDLLCKGALIGMPRMLGLREARVEMSKTAEGVTYTVDLPAERGIVPRLRRLIAWPVSARTAARELREANELLFERSGELVTETTSRASVEAALQESESRFYKAFHAAPTLMAINTFTGEFVDVNESMARACGVSREDLTGGRMGAFDFWVDPEQRSRIIEQLRAGQTVRGVEATFRNRAGEHRVGLVSAEIITLEGQPCVLWQSVDITDRKLAEENNRLLQEQMLQAQKLESLGVMAGGIAHDFNNLLVGMLGNAELALTEIGSDDESARRRIEEVLAASRRAAGLTREMLAYAGKGKLTAAPVDLAELVHETAKLLRSGLPKNTVLDCRVENDGGVWISADDTQIRQVVMNLMTNAAEAYGEEAGTVEVRVAVVDADESWNEGSYLGNPVSAGRYARVRVGDSGCGMDPDTRKKIFDPFFTTKFTGRGLGLAATLGIVTSHGGALKVCSREGEGTVFEVLLPLGAGPPARDVQEPVRLVESPEGSILIVDDEEGVRSVVQLMLEPAGYRTLLADRGTAAVELLREHRDEIVAVLLDLTMPGMSGEETFQELRRIDDELPVVCCSGHGDEVGRRWMAGKSRVTFLAKPFTRERIFESLQKLL